jgi:drug/metabolite transporter (DMT)-like permease
MGADGHDSSEDAHGLDHSHKSSRNGGNTNNNGNGISTGEGDGVMIPAGTDDATAKKRTGTRVSASSGGTGGPGGVVPGRRRIRKVKKQEAALETPQTKCIKYAALFLLVAQMVGLVLLMRYSRTQPRRDDEPLYLASSAVFVMEVMKLVICVAVVVYQTPSDVLGELYHHTVGSPAEIAKLCVPSLLYTVQNNLLYLALTNLDAATYQVCYQLKILTTALFSAILLQRKFSPTKWAALVVLTLGVAVVQLSGSTDQHSSTATSTDHHETVAEADSRNAESQNRLIGLIAVICAACTSGFSGVYFGTCASYRWAFLDC